MFYLFRFTGGDGATGTKNYADERRTALCLQSMWSEIQERFEVILNTARNFSLIAKNFSSSLSFAIAFERMWTRRAMSVVSQSRHSKAKSCQTHGKAQARRTLAACELYHRQGRNSNLNRAHQSDDF